MIKIRTASKHGWLQELESNSQAVTQCSRKYLMLFPSTAAMYHGRGSTKLMLRCLQTIILVTIVAEYVHAYEIDKEHQGPQPCGGRLKGPVGTITTPNFPNPFPVPIKCKWIIEHDIVNGTISIYFTQQYTTSGLTFTEYMYYDESYKLGERRALTLTDENITRIKWLQG
ncbi:hypothetical protein HW555_006862 [Spodoptera exigua]|uniref:CUB domain-containing protein n=1 Tax=Spodoptera exigua TaxID=7107 RepID=A0A835GH03_SPOEX|nr:hypothetical protein HW555_006862 [Spodoptera exigua]